MWYIYTMEYYPAIKKNEILPFAATWMQPEINILSEIRNREISHDVTYTWNLEHGAYKPIYKTETVSYNIEKRL